MGDDNNKGVAFESFLEGIFEQCNRCRVEKNISGWYDLLIVATLNLSAEMDSYSLLRFKELKKSLVSKINSLEVKNTEMEILIVPDDIEELLFDWEVDLRKIRRDAGLQHKVNSDKRRFT